MTSWLDSLPSAAEADEARPSCARTYFSEYAKVAPAHGRSRAGSTGSRGSNTSKPSQQGYRRWQSAQAGVCPCCGRARETPEPRGSRTDLSEASTALPSSRAAADESLSSAELTSSLVRDWTEPDTVRAHRRVVRERQKRGTLARPSGRTARSKSTRRSLEVDFCKAVKLPTATTPAPPETTVAEDQPCSRESKGAEPATPLKPQVDVAENVEPPPSDTGKNKGKGKGKSKPLPPPPPPGAAPRSTRKVAKPYARRLDWRALAAEKLKDTVFHGLAETGSVNLVDARRLENCFGHQTNSATEKPSSTPQEVELFSHRRAQNMLIAFRRRPLTAEVLRALRDFAFEALSLETLEVLVGAMPSQDEEKQLLAFQGDPGQLRDAERQLLPLARLPFPPARLRMKLGLLQRTLTASVEALNRRLGDIRGACVALSRSRALRRALVHVLFLGNALNHGLVHGASSQLSVRGFSIEVLPRLVLLRATQNTRITLLHVLVSQLQAENAQLPENLIEDLSPVRRAVSAPLAQLAHEVAAFAAEAADARKGLREAFPGLEAPETFFIGDDEGPQEVGADIDEDEELRGPQPPETPLQRRQTIRQILDHIYTKVAHKAPPPLMTLADTASAAAAELQASLAATRDKAAAMLGFFAFGDAGGGAADSPFGSSSPQVVNVTDAKCAEFFQIMQSFLDAFETCVAESMVSGP
ncbi:FH20 [Symbiodinium sp. CCMP2592]|nr:FH20 [Symbiodinium sp. CCMP2592]